MADFLGGLFRAIFQTKLDTHGVPTLLVWPDGDAPTLVVFAHEWAGSGLSRWRLKRVLWGQPADRAVLAPAADEASLTPDGENLPLGPVDLLAPVIVKSIWDDTSPIESAWALQKAINHRVRERAEQGRPYEQVVLVGYSAGALVLRKAMVWGLGQLEDHPHPELGQEQQWRWALDDDGSLGQRIRRVVLIAGINRGWSLEERPADMPVLKYLVYLLLRLIAKLPLIYGFILALERGAPFVADLRLQWLRLERRLGSLPPTIQLLGTVDDIVSPEDNKDVLALENAKVLSLDGADHRSVMHVHDTRYRQRLIEALTPAEPDLQDRVATAMDRAEIERALRGESNAAPAEEEFVVSMVVLPVHGIRANADWCIRLRRELQARAGGRVIFCPCRSYGHFSILRFLLFGRRRMVRWFVDLYTEAIAMVADPTVPVHVVAHSNGSYMVARSLLDYHTVTIDRLALAGSVLQRHFPWRRLYRQHRLGELRNERAARDLVVGFFPGFYQQIGALMPGALTFFDIGNAGLLGFDDPPLGQDVERFYLNGGHGAAVEPKNIPHLAGFLLGEPEQERKLELHIPWWISLFSNLAWLVWLTIALMLVALGWWLATAIHPATLLLYAFLLIIIIATV